MLLFHRTYKEEGHIGRYCTYPQGGSRVYPPALARPVLPLVGGGQGRGDGELDDAQVVGLDFMAVAELLHPRWAQYLRILVYARVSLERSGWTEVGLN